jgi:hypothetical protein
VSKSLASLLAAAFEAVFATLEVSVTLLTMVVLLRGAP